MGGVYLKPDTDRRVYVIVQDPNTRKSRQITLYGVTPAQAIKLIREAVSSRAAQAAAADAKEAA